MKIISGGQSGVDRAALDFCLENNIPCGGWCPKGRLAEDGIIPEKYPLSETQSDDYNERTRMNVRDSDATLFILDDKPMDAGTEYTLAQVTKAGKIFTLVDVSYPLNFKGVKEWFEKNQVKILNVAGPRESSNPGIYKKTMHYLSKLDKHINISH